MVSRYDVPVHFWTDLLRVGEAQAHGSAMVDVDVARRMQEYDEAHPGPARRAASDVGAFGALVPVLPVGSAAAGPPVSRRPFCDALARSAGAVPFPDAGVIVSVPTASTAGVTTTSQSAENVTITDSTPVFAAISTTMFTVAARVNVSRQAFERNNNPNALTAMVRNAIDSHVEAAVIGTLVSSASTITVTATTGPEQVKATLDGASRVATAMAAPAEFVLLNPRRFDHWAAQSCSSTNVPISWDRPALAGIPLIQSGGVSTTFNTSQDRVIVSRWDALVFSEDAPRVRAVPGSVSTGTGTVTLIASQYVAFTTRGYASAVQSLTSTGLGPPSFA